MNLIMWIKRILGYKVIVCCGNNEAPWYTILRVSPWDGLYAWRYDHAKSGFVALSDDGTGSYCGPIKWMYA